MPVAEDLDLDVPRALELFARHRARRRRRRSAPPTGSGRTPRGFRLRSARAHAAPPAAGDGLEHDRRDSRSTRRTPRASSALLTAAPSITGAPARRAASRAKSLSPNSASASRRRADEGQAGLRDGAREAGVLGQEAVARMDRVAARRLGERHDAGGVEIGGGACAAERMRFVRLPQVKRGRVVLGIDRDAGDLQFGRGAGDPDGDLAAVGIEQPSTARFSAPSFAPVTSASASVTARWTGWSGAT